MWKYKIGTVVQEKDGSWNRALSGEQARPMFGHIVGFANNGYETILKVQWDDESIRQIHPSNVVFEEDTE
jgi:hypothetical protein